ncbi:HAD family hydrolase [Butyrivibrio sp. AD3002]|uniref:HAD family hydrolase n=1 Tax=Butyrivibrio sp. AD3002 TaxID=1280670 RepID=UPI0003B332CB|nr:HAD family hydrolase [Butyrivibrio sp. AD3002]
MDMKYKNYIFDLYGTLIDIHTDEEQPELWEFMADYLAMNFSCEYDAKKLRKDYLRICRDEEKKLAKANGSKFPEIKIEWVWERLIGKPCSDADMRLLCNTFRERSRDRLVQYEGVAETLTAIKKSGGKVFLLSNAQRLFTEKELEDTNLTNFFDDIFISSDMGVKKPDERFLLELLEKHGLKKDESVMIGNEVLADVSVATGAGIDAIYLNTYAHTQKEIQRDLKICHADTDRVNIVDDGNILSLLRR